MKRTLPLSGLLLIVILIVVVLLTWFWAQSKPPDAPTPEPEVQATPQEYAAIEQAIRQEIEVQAEGIPLMLLYDTKIYNINISADGNWATAWIAPVDPESGEVIPVEPGVVILRKEEGVWLAILPSDPRWAATLRAVPEELVPPESAVAGQEDLVFDKELISATYSGYLLPWAGGETMALTQSVGHDRYTPSGNAHYAFDFAMPGYPSGMFNVHAARSGTVKQAVWHHENGNESFANYLVLEDTSTEPTTYQLYLHFAKDSIPLALRQVGAPVVRGQFIGVADDTGISSGNHLHFMVHTNPASYWGTSVDITFDDVAINGGRPRISSDLPYCWDSDICDEVQYLYVSQNFISPDHTAPTGSIWAPQHGITVQSDTLFLEGWAADDNSGIASAQFTARYNGAWNLIGEEFSSEQFSLDWDLCSDQVPDGPISLALEIWDRALNRNADLPGLRHFSKNSNCPPPPPACVPASNQVALFAAPDFSGACVVLNAGSYTLPGDFGALGINNADSLRVGSGIQATLYKEANLRGRGETFSANDSNLSDNRIGANSVASVRVQARTTAPAAPVLTWPEAGETFNDDASFSLAWDNGGGATQYQARLQPESGDPILTAWDQKAFWHLNSLPAGSYTWQARARNAAGESPWSGTRSFLIQVNSTSPPPSVGVPFEDDMEDIQTQWTRSPYWDRNQEYNHTPGGSISWKYDTNTSIGYDTGGPNAGYLTSPPLELPADGQYYLRFWYYYETEGPGIHWDQRWVQVSVGGGEFVNLLQLSDDVANFWLRSPAIPLGAYAGQTIQVRFYFATLDSAFNQYKGWYIDDVSITEAPPADCDDGKDGFIDAPIIGYNSATSGVICPAGDIDYYRFQAVAGDQVGVRIQAQALGSELDSYLYLLDIDGRSILAENDDLVYGENTDSWITYRLTRTGTYYIKLRSWYHPTNGDEAYTYTLRLYEETDDPEAAFIYPTDSGDISRLPIELLVSAEDPGSGVSRVQFLWHTADWNNSDWILLGEDWDGSDGWRYPFDASALPDTKGIAFYARVFDWAGNWIGVGAWNMGIPKIYLPLISK